MLKSIMSRLNDETGLSAVGVVLGVLLIILAFSLAVGTHSALFLLLVVLAVICIIFL